jgi:thiol-disulfide isomerase/thioredoxin
LFPVIIDYNVKKGFHPKTILINSSMKLFYLTAGMMLMAGVAFSQQKPFTIKGKVEGKTNEYIYLTYASAENGKFITDSVMIRDGRFSFSGKVDGVVQGTIMMNMRAAGGGKYVPLLLSAGTMQLTVDYNNFNNSLLTGSPAQDEINKLNQMKAAITAELTSLNEAYAKVNAVYSAAVKEGKDEETLKKLKKAVELARNAFNPLRERSSHIERDFLKKYPSGFAAANILRTSINNKPWQESMANYVKLSKDVKKSSLGKEILKEITALKMGSPGSMATIFTSTELRGEKLSLSDFRGKYVLLDFWASWCVPCRKGNPHLLALYAKYKEKGFEIIGISDDDRNHAAWKKAINDDKIDVWKHVLIGLKWNGNVPDRSADISNNYGISTLPTKVLIDPNGLIIGRYGGGGENEEAMDKKLAEIFGHS